MLQEISLAADGHVLNVAVGPLAGPPLVLLHGVGRRWQDYLTIVPPLSMRWHVHALDFRGHGLSARRPGEYLVVDYVRDALALVRNVATRPAVVYGHSLGAMVAAAVAAEAPESVAAVVLEDPPFDTLAMHIKQTQYFAMFQGFQTLARRERSVRGLSASLADLPVGLPGQPAPVRLGSLRDAASLRFLARCLTQLDPEVFTPLLAGLWLDGYDRDAILRRIDRPVLLLQGNHSLGGMLPDADADEVAALLPDCTLIRMSQVGHQIHAQATEATLRHVTSFLESL